MHSMHKGALLAILAASIAVAVFAAAQQAQASINRSLDVGSSGSDVTQLQTYLATNSSWYPEGIVSGYFGPLTQAAVQRFQAAQGIVSSGSPSTTGYGRVGPQTRTRINVLLGGGVSWDAVPTLSTPAVSAGATTATLTWTTNEATEGQVFYDKATLRIDEATGPHQLPYASGTLVTATTNGSATSYIATISGLQPNTEYHYFVRVIDSGGNVTMILPTTFRTN